MRQKPTRIFANQPIPTCSGFTCMGCLKRPRGPSGTCHSKAKVPRASIPLNAATSEICAISGVQFVLVFWVISWCHVFYSGAVMAVCCLSWGCSFVHTTNRKCIWDVLPQLCRNGNFARTLQRKKNLWSFNKGNVLLKQSWSNQFSEFLWVISTHFSGWCISNQFLTIKILTSWFSSDLWMFKKRWVTFPVSNII